MLISFLHTFPHPLFLWSTDTTKMSFTSGEQSPPAINFSPNLATACFLLSLSGSPRRLPLPFLIKRRRRESKLISRDTIIMASQAGQIRTVVILVQENRSFDHMLGWMKLLNPSINGVTGAESNPISTSDSSAAAVPFRDQAEYVDPDPGHSIQAIYEQVYGVPFAAGDTPITVRGVVPPMNGFVQQAERQQKGMSEAVMNGFLPESVPVYRELVAEFAVCDRWFASVPASTQPNRLFVHSATSHGLTSNDTGKLVAGMPQKTIFDSLDEAGLDFGIYYQYPPSTLFYRFSFRSMRRPL